MANFTYTFEELPLAIDANGIEGGFINGSADIYYTRRGSWDIGQIMLEGFGQRINGVREWPMIECPMEISSFIRKRLENEWRDRVESAVAEQIEQDREDAIEIRADYIRERRMDTV